MIDVCCLQDVRWRGLCSRILAMGGRRYKLWWFAKGDWVGGVEVMVKEELCEKLVEIGRVSSGVMAVVLVFEEDVLWLICGHVQQSGRSFEEKQSFYDKLKGGWGMHSADSFVMCFDEFNGHMGRHIYGFDDGMV